MYVQKDVQLYLFPFRHFDIIYIGPILKYRNLDLIRFSECMSELMDLFGHLF